MLLNPFFFFSAQPLSLGTTCMCYCCE